MYREGIWEVGEKTITGYFEQGPWTIGSDIISGFYEQYAASPHEGQLIGVYMNSPTFSQPYLMFSYQQYTESGLCKALKDFASRSGLLYRELQTFTQNYQGQAFQASPPPIAGNSLNRKPFNQILYWILFSLLILEALAFIIAETSLTVVCVSLVLILLFVFVRKTLTYNISRVLSSYLLAFVLVIVISGLTANTSVSTDADFRKYADFGEESKASSVSMEAFKEAALKGDIQESLSNILPEKRDQYGKLFSKDLKKLEMLGNAMKRKKIVYLSNPDTVSEYNPRMAEYEVEYEGNVFYIRMYKLDGVWLIEIV